MMTSLGTNVYCKTLTSPFFALFLFAFNQFEEFAPCSIGC